MAETYIQMFQEEYYPHFFRELADETIKQFVENEEKLIEQWKNSMCRYFERVIQLQKMKQAEPVSEIIFSFLYTSLAEQKTLFRVDCYGEAGHVFSDSMLTDYLPGDWLTGGLDELGEKLNACAAEEGLRRYIRPAEIEVLKLRAVRSLLNYFAMRFKYTIQEVLDYKVLAGMTKTEEFVISMGEYMDWQRPIFAMLPEVDIFNCDRDTGLQFRRFPAIYYRDKEFKDLVLNHSRFLDCTFTDVTIENCSMNDCVFEHCTFENVTIENTQMLGCSFLNCTHVNTLFDNVDFYEKDAQQEEYYEPVEWDRNELSSCRFHSCRLNHCIVTDCDVKNVEIVGGDVAESELLKYNGVMWLQESGECTLPPTDGGNDGVF